MEGIKHLVNVLEKVMNDPIYTEAQRNAKVRRLVRKIKGEISYQEVK